MGGASQQGFNLRQAEIGVDQLSDGLCYRLGSDLGPLDLLSEGREFLLELLRLSLPFGIQIDEVVHRRILSTIASLDDLLEVASRPASKIPAASPRQKRRAHPTVAIGRPGSPQRKSGLISAHRAARRRYAFNHG